MELTDPSDAGVYLVRFGGKAALIDAGTGRNNPQLMKNIGECLEPDVQLEYLLLTHCHFDHTGGARAVRDECGCRIVAHELDAIHLESGDDRVTAAAQYGAHLEPLAIDIRLKEQEFSKGEVYFKTNTIKSSFPYTFDFFFSFFNFRLSFKLSLAFFFGSCGALSFVAMISNLFL